MTRQTFLRPSVLRTVSICILFEAALVVLLLLLCGRLWGQTTVDISNTVQTSGVSRFGINLGSSSAYGPSALEANLIATYNPSFTSQIAQMRSICSSYTSSVWTDDDPDYNHLPANFWQGASYQIVSGANVGQTGTIVSSTAGANGTAMTVTVSGTLTGACTSSGGTADAMILRQDNPPADWSGNFTPAQFQASGAGPAIDLNGTGAAASYETTDLSPDTKSDQQLELTAPGSATAAIIFYFDENCCGAQEFLNLNGTYTVNFRAKATSGTPTLTANVTRGGIASYLNEVVTPTVNATPGAGWTNYSYTFTADETGAQTETATFTLTATNGTVLLADPALVEAQEESNPTILRDAVFDHLKNDLKPGSIRYMEGNVFGCDLDTVLEPDGGRKLCAYNPIMGTNIAYPNPVNEGPNIGLPDFLEIANAIGAAPWYTVGAFFSPTDYADLVEYLAGTCGNGNAYTTIRCDAGQTTPWTTVFADKGQKIYIEDGNELWNSVSPISLFGENGTVYGRVNGPNNAAARAAPDYTSTIALVADGWAAPGQTNENGWLNNVLTQDATYTNGQTDYIDGAPYLYDVVTDDSSNAAIFNPMIAQTVNWDSLTTGPIYTQGHYAESAFGVKSAIYEDNLGTGVGLASLTQAQVNGVVAGQGAAMTVMEHLLLALRDAQITGPQNVFTLLDWGNSWNACSSTTGGCGQATSVHTPLWGSVYMAAGGGAANTVDRPVGIALRVLNGAIGSNTNLLTVTQTGTPTENVPAGQPDPTNGGSDSIAANAAVPLVQTFAFGDGNGHYALVAFNNSLTNSEVIDFSGSGAPTGTVTRTAFAATSPAANNENVTLAAPTCSVCMPPSTTMSSPTSDTLAPFSMTTYTWGGATPAASGVLLSGRLIISGTVRVQ